MWLPKIGISTVVSDFGVFEDFLTLLLRHYKIVLILISITNWGSNHLPYDSHHHILITTLRMRYIFRRGKLDMIRMS